MRKFFFLIAVMAFCAQGINASVITPAQAEVIAKQQFAKSTKLNASNVKMTLNYAAMNLKGQTDYYVFNREDGNGFVIVAGDDLSTPVLGYSPTGSFNFDEAPDLLKEMLECYQNSLEMKRHNPSAAKAPRLNYNLQPYGVSPICGQVHWHQFPPYNNNCPTSPRALTSNGRCYAGCVPVAFSTIMKGLRHPYKGFGENRYTYMLDGNEMTAYAKFDDWSYNYSQMKNGYGENAYNAQAVSELVYEVGVAFHTIFSPSSSDALLRNVFRGMIAFFDFNSNIQYVQKSSYAYNDSVWYEMMYNELNNGRPIYYMGYRTIDNEGNACNIGHAFVLDGYDANGKVHVNWGFQPDEYNTYFDWELLSPRPESSYAPYSAYDSGFNHNQAAIIGISPDTTGIGGVVVKNVNLVADTMPANDLRITIDIQSLSGIWNGTLKYGIVSKGSDGKYSPIVTKTATGVQIDEDYGIATLDLSGDYSLYYMTQGKTYYVVVYTPYFASSSDPDWMWFLDDPVPFTVGDWVTPPEPEWALGDVNHDHVVNVADVTALIQYVLTSGEQPEEFFADLANVDGDEAGQINVADVTALIQLVLNN